MGQGVFNIFQAKDPKTVGNTEQEPPTIYNMYNIYSSGIVYDIYIYIYIVGLLNYVLY